MRRRIAILTAAFAALLAVSAVPAKAEQKFIVFFHAWSGEMDPAAQDVVAAAANYARQNPAMQVEVVGFASTTGSRQSNLYLSLLRAQLVSDRIAEAGIAPARIARVGEGSVNVVGTIEEARRVEIVVRAP
ncbi:MAG: OmpA family protein [Alphaproteobacteria bacterium]|nr:OmpA family protein [Alphaproteobacteria bacterium]